MIPLIFMKSIALKPRDKVICTSQTFIGVQNVIDVWTKMYDADVVCLDMPRYIKSEDEVDFLEQYLAP